MKPTIARSFAGTVLTMFLGHTAAAQRPAPLTVPMPTPAGAAVRVESSGPSPSLTFADRERLDATMRRADTLVLESKLVEANHLYWSVVAEQRAAEEYPVAALNHLALAYFGAGDDYAAATVLAELAESAAEFGDPATRLQSLFEAALMFRDAGRSDRVMDCVRQLRPLLRSAAIPEATRTDIAGRIVLR